MSNWRKISLFKFQQIDEINQRDIPEIDKTLFAICKVFDFTEYELDNMAPKRATKYINKIGKIFTSTFEPIRAKWFKFYRVQYDPSKLTFGQYIELSYFFQSKNRQGENDCHIRNGHYILASICNYPGILKRFSDDHRKKANYFLQAPIEKVIGTIKPFMENFNEFNKEYSGLFGLSDETSEEVKTDKFNRRYGWIYSASVVAEYERITLDEAYRLPIRRVLNNLMYLKEKASYEEQQLKKHG